MRNSKSPVRLLVRPAAALLRARLSRKRHRALRERRAGEQLAEALGTLRGVYTKLGQELARRADLFSDELREPLSRLVDRAPPADFAQVHEQLERALGEPPPFAWIDPEPLGTASIAQVHRARTRDGCSVAVKVRHAELTPERIAADLQRLRRAARWLRPWLPGIEATPLIDELGLALRQEIDFEREARVAAALAASLADDPRIVVPAVHAEASRGPVLCYDFVPGVRLDDPAELSRRGVAPEACARIVADAYGRQVFGDGFFHADPHAGNLYLVDESHPEAPPGGPGPRILFLDFGLAQRLPAQLREELRLGFQALLKRDVEALIAGLERIGALIPGREEQARAAAREALEAGAAEALGSSAANVRALEALGKRIVRESGAFRVPRELLLYARTLAYVYGLCERIAPGSDPMPSLLPHLLRFLTRSPEPRSREPLSASEVEASAAGR